MKIKRSLFTNEIEFEIGELEAIRYRTPQMGIGLLFWIKEKFGLDMLPKFKKEDK